MSDADPTRFINREKEVGLIINMVSELAKGKPFSPKERVFHFFGPSGIGKSFLLKKIRTLLLTNAYKELSIVPVFVSLDKSTFGRLESVNGVLKTVYEEFCKYSEVTANPVLKEPLMSKSDYARIIMRVTTLHKVFPILLLDEINILSNKDMQDIERLFLADLLHANHRVVLITAGRSIPSVFNDFALRPNFSNIFLLPVFDEEKTSEQIRSLKPGSEVLANKIWKLGSGVPGNTVKLVDCVSDDNFNTLNEKLAIQSLLDEVKRANYIEERYYPILEAISILQGFFPEDLVPLFQIHPQLSNGWDESKVKEVFLDLSQVQVGPGGLVDWDREKKHFAMDESTRALFEKELQMREPELWKKLHCTALGMYREWAQKYNSDMYRNKSNYHQQRLQSAGMTCE